MSCLSLLLLILTIDFTFLAKQHFFFSELSVNQSYTFIHTSIYTSNPASYV